MFPKLFLSTPYLAGLPRRKGPCGSCRMRGGNAIGPPGESAFFLSGKKMEQMHGKEKRGHCIPSSGSCKTLPKKSGNTFDFSTGIRILHRNFDSLFFVRSPMVRFLVHMLQALCAICLSVCAIYGLPNFAISSGETIYLFQDVEELSAIRFRFDSAMSIPDTIECLDLVRTDSSSGTLDFRIAKACEDHASVRFVIQ